MCARFRVGSRHLGKTLSLVASLAVAAICAPQPSPQGAAVTSIAQVRNLPAKVTGDAPKIMLRGVVTSLSGWKNSFFLQDATAGISIDRQETTNVRVGNEVEVTGTVHPGLFAPVVVSGQVAILGNRKPPRARSSTYADLAGGQLDSRWVELHGVVHSARFREIWGRQILLLELQMAGGQVAVHVLDFPRQDPGYLVDSEVRLRGVCGTVFNHRRQIIGLRLFVPALSQIQVDAPAADPFSLPLSSPQTLLGFNPAFAVEHRVRITGIVIHQIPGSAVYLEENGAGVLVRTQQKDIFKPGTRVEAAGFVSPDGYSPALRNAVIRSMTWGSAPLPVHTAAASIIAIKDGFGFAPDDGLLVELEADVVERLPQADGYAWLLKDRKTVFQAGLSGTSYDRKIGIEPGSRVRLTGICAVETDENRNPKAFHILLRGPDDIAILHTPYWTVSRSFLLAILSLVLGAGMLVLALVRARSRKPMEVEEFGRSAWASGFEVTSKALAAILAAVGVLVLIGWTCNLQLLKSVRPDYVAMKPNAALALLAAAVALWLTSGRRKRSTLTGVLSGLVVAIGALTLLEYLTGWDLHIDQLFSAESGALIATLSPGRMAFVTALGFLLLGTAIWLIRHVRFAAAAQISAIAAGVLGLLSLVGYLYGIQNFYGVAAYTAMAFHTAVCTVLLSLAVLFCRADCGLMAAVSSSAPGGVLARRLLPAAFLVPSTLGYLRWEGQLSGLYDTAFGLALFASANIVSFGFLIWNSAAYLNRLDLARSRAAQQAKAAEAQVRSLNEDLERRVLERTIELRGTNDELSYTRARLQSVLDSATEVAIVALDLDGIIQLFSKGAELMLQYSAAEVVGKCTPSLFHGLEDQKRRAALLSENAGRTVDLDEIYAASLLPVEPYTREGIYVRRDGTVLSVNLAVAPMLDTLGRRVGTLGVASDITARKAIEHELQLNNEKLAEQTRRAQEANSAKSDFLATMSHEIRTPMNAIVGLADILWETKLDPEQMECVELFRRAGSNLLLLINDILDLSKIEAGHLELEQVDFNLEEVVDQAIELTAVKARGKGLHLFCRLSPGVPGILVGDPSRLRQILINLLGNAVKFTDSGEIVLTVQNSEAGESGEIEFAVSDTGVGIPPEKLESIFEDFTQADSSITRKYGGTGLGLGISRRLVERMGGLLTATSKVGQGSRFRFNARFGIGMQSEPQTSLDMHGLDGRRVLVVDDNATNRFILRETLQAWGLESHEFSRPQDALASLADAGEQPYSLALVDSCMPGMDGFETAKRIRSVAPNVPVVMLTSDAQPGDSVRRAVAGLAGFAVKPVRRADLLRLICDAMQLQENREMPPGASVNRPAQQVAPLRILVADDSLDNRLVIQLFLKGSPHRLEFAENGKAALDLFDSMEFDLILMDMQMPVMDGLTATRAIRAIERERGIVPTPILALTANARPEDVAMSRVAGCDDHLSKPIAKDKLLEVIADYGQHAAPQSMSIGIPPGMEEIVPGYLEARRKEVPEMFASLADSDFVRLAALGHNMKGSGAMYGFPQLTAMGAALEQAAKINNKEELGNQLTSLEAFLEKLQPLAVI